MSDGGPQQAADGGGREWYDGGLRFTCTQCGNCCTGPSGFVWFTPDEGRAMARALGEEESAFLATYARRVGERWTLEESRTAQGFDCVLLDRTSEPGKALCRVYRDRPAQCRSWPFWPDNLTSRSTWARVKEVTPCPGMDQGRLYPIEEIRIIRDGTATGT